MNEKTVDCTVFCSLGLKIAKVCARPRKGMKMGGMDCSSGKKRTQSITHDLDELAGKSRVCVYVSVSVCGIRGDGRRRVRWN